MKLFEKKLNHKTKFFAYPFGEYKVSYKKIVKELGFDYGFGQHSGVMDLTKDKYELPRFPINEKYGETKRFKRLLKTIPFPYKKIIPEERYLKAVKFFSSEYFDDPKIFDGSFTATFSKDSSILKKILIKKKFNVQFFQDNMGFDFEVKVIKLKKKEPLWLFTFFHNSFFNPQLNEDIEILYFKPEITSAKKII